MENERSPVGARGVLANFSLSEGAVYSAHGVLWSKNAQAIGNRQ
jgi:hypothetical protein